MPETIKDGLQDYQTPNLFLLIGTNPLPNYIVARLLLKQSEGTRPNLVLVHTKEVCKYAESLKCLLDKEISDANIHIDVQVEEAEPWDIVSKVAKKLIDLRITSSDQVGLNYTGGTKAMAVSTYRAIKDKFPFARLSYLDARGLCLIFERVSENSYKYSVRDSISISMEKMLSLHKYRFFRKKENGHEIDERPKTDPEHNDLARVIADNGLISELNQWMHDNYRCISERARCNSNYFSLTKSKREKAINEEVGCTLPGLSLPTYEQFECLKGEFGPATTFGTLAAKWNTSAEKTALYLDGGWLEDHVLNCLRSIKDDAGLSEIGMNLKAQPDPPERPDDYFEIDNYAIRGYQLFAISCGSGSYKSSLKLKLYEILVHARQMGGDEARVALVCGNENPQRIERELVQDWNIPSGTIRVFGKGDIQDLADKLKDWITQNRTEEVSL